MASARTMWPSWLYHQLTSFVQVYPQCKFGLHTISGSSKNITGWFPAHESWSFNEWYWDIVVCTYIGSHSCLRVVQILPFYKSSHSCQSVEHSPCPLLAFWFIVGSDYCKIIEGEALDLNQTPDQLLIKVFFTYNVV